jgi:DNA polymerase-3 subunit chi
MSHPNLAAPTEVLFYHLEQQTLDKVLPTLVEKTLERGWRAVVQAGSQERLEAIDLALWTYKEDSFLAHGSAKDGHASEQPVYLTTTGETPNGAGVRFLVDGAEAEAFSGFVRVVYMFDGNDADAVKVARAQWTEAKSAGCPVTYWQQRGAQGLSLAAGANRNPASFAAVGGMGPRGPAP